MSKYGDALDTMDQDRERQAATVAGVASRYNPDQYAEAIARGSELDVPAHIVADNPQAFERKSKYGEVLDRQDAPATQEWMTNLDNAAVAQDDVENLSGVERYFRNVVKSVAGAAGAGPETREKFARWPVNTARLTVAQAKSGAAGIGQFLADRTTAINLAASQSYHVRPDAPEWERRQSQAAIDAALERVTVSELQSGRLQRVARRGRLEASEAMPKDAGLLERAAMQGVSSASTSLAATLIAGPAGGASVLGASTFGNRYAELTDLDFSTGEATKSALMLGAMETLTEYLPGKALVKETGKFWGKVAEFMAAELPGENIASLTEMLDDYRLQLREDITVDDLAASIRDTSLATVIGGGVQLGAVQAFSQAAEVANGRAVAREAGIDLNAIDAAIKSHADIEQLNLAVQNTKLAARSPEKLEELVSAIKTQTGSEFAYIDPAAFRTLYQSDQEAAQAAAELTGSSTTYFEAAVSNSKIAVPIEKYVARVAANKNAQALIDHVTFSPDGLTAEEAKIERELLEGRAKEIADREVTEARPDSSEAIYDDVLGQLLATGMERSTAEKNAALTQVVFRTLGQRSGIDAQQLYERYGLKIQRHIPGAGTIKRVDAAIDPLIDQLRAGDVPSPQQAFGTSMLEFIRSKGGLKDEGGELAARDIDKGGKAFQRNIIQKEGRSLDDMAEQLVEAGYISERDPNLVLDLISKEIAGSPVYAAGNVNAVGAGRRAQIEWMNELISRAGIDLKTADNETIKKALALDDERAALLDYLPSVDELTESGLAGVDEAFEVAMVTRATELDPALVERLAVQYAEDDSGFITAVRAFLNEQDTEAAARSEESTGPQEGLTSYDQNERPGQSAGTETDQDSLRTVGGGRPAQGWQAATRIRGKSGQPFRLYRGSSRPISASDFSDSSLGAATGHPTSGLGVFFTTDQSDASRYGAVSGAFLDLRKPKLIKIEDVPAFDSIEEAIAWREKQKSAGHDGLVISASHLGGPNWVIAFSPDQVIVEPSPNILEQRFDETRRGAIQFGADRQFTISLLEKADLSTYLHESGHLYLELLGDLAEDSNAPQQIKDDYATVLKWMGVKDRASIQTDQHEQWARGFEAYLREGKSPSVEMQSVFARFRAWLVSVYKTLARLNVTLTDDVRRVMDRIVATDEEIAAAEESQNYAPIFTSAEEAGMSPEEWAAYKDIATRAHQEAVIEMTDRALNELTREQKAWWKEERAKVRDAVLAEVNEQPVYRALAFLQKGTNADGSPLPEGIQAAKLNKQALVDKYGKDFLKRLPRGLTAKDGVSPDVAAGLFGFDSGDALVEALANARPKTQLIEMEADARMRETHGDMLTDGSLAEQAMQSVHTEARAKVMAAELKALNRQRREVKPFVKAAEEQARRERAQARDANYGNLLSPEQIREIREQAALQVSLNKDADATDYRRLADSAGKKAFDLATEGNIEEAVQHKRIEVLNRELYYAAIEAREDARTKAERDKQTQQRQAREANAATLPDADELKAIKAGVQRIMQAKKVRDIQPNLYRMAEAKAARKAFDLAGKGKYEEAYQEKRRQILNHELYRAAVKAREEVDSIVEYMRTFDKKATRERIAKAKGEYLEQIDSLRERFDFSNVSNIADLKRTALAQWVAEQEAAGREVNVPEHLLNEARKTPYKELLLAELQGLSDAVKNIEHLAKTKDRMLKNRKESDWQEAKQELSERIEGQKGKAPPVSRFERSNLEEYGAMAQDMADSWLRPETIVEWLDGGESGPWHDYLMEPANNAEYRRETLREQVLKPLRDLAEKVTRKRRAELHEEIQIRSLGKSFNRRTLLSIALNMGNDSNKDRLTKGGFRDGGKVRKFTPESLQEILAALNAEDVKFLNTAWATVEQLWPETVEFQKRMGGLVPEKIQAKTIQTKHGELTGGYWPVVYDSLATRAGQTQAESSDPIATIMGQNFTRASTKKGHLKGRTAVAGPLLLDYSAVAGRHTEQVITDITHREFALQAMKVLDDGDLRLKLQDALGETAWTSLRGMVRHAVEQGGGYSDAANRGQERIMRRILSNTAVAALGFRAVTAWGNMALAPIQAGARIAPKYIAIGMGKFYRHPMESTKFIHDSSEMMKQRAKNMDHTFNVVMETLKGQRGFRAKAAEAAMSMHSTADFLATHGLWLGRYQEALDAGESHDESVRLADKSIRQTQTAGAPKDLSAFERDPRYSWFKMFLGPMLIQGNRIRESFGRRGVVKSWPQAFGTLMAAWFLPAVLWDLMTGRGPDDDDDDLENESLWALRKIFFYPLMTMPFLRDAASIVERKIAGQYAEPRMTPLADAAYLVYQAGQSAAKETGDWMDGDEFEADKVMKAGLRASGPLFGIPSNQIDVTGSYLYDLATGAEEMESIGDLRYLAIRRD